MLARFAMSCLAAGIVWNSPGAAATRTQPYKDHRWQGVTIAGLPAAIATRCADCPAEIVLRCLARGRGLMQLELLGAAVANGRVGATKQIRLTIGADSERRRALTIRQPRGFTPVIKLAADDLLLGRFERGGVLRINFYGQRSVIGLRGAAGPVAQVRNACLPMDSPVQLRHCTWSVVMGCHAERRAVAAVARTIPDAFVRETSDGYCATLASDDLAGAQARASRYGGYVARSCLP